MTRAFFLDGVTAALREVDVSVEGAQLRIVGAGVDESWPLADTLRAPSFSTAEARFMRPKGEARIRLLGEAAAELKAAAPDLFRPRCLRAVAGVAALAAGALSAVAAAVWLWPAASGVLARMTPVEVEAQLGYSTLELVDSISYPCDVPYAAQREANMLGWRLARAADSPFGVDIAFVDADFPNAFALPGGRIVVTDELIALLDTPEQLAGVLAHETAHVARRHVMAAVIRETGVGAAVDLMLGGGSGAGQQLAMAGLQLQSLSHTRRAEEEADELGVAYLGKIGVDPHALPAFLERIDEISGGRQQTGFAELLLTHPSPAKRAERGHKLADAAARSRRTYPALSDDAWQTLKDTCGG